MRKRSESLAKSSFVLPQASELHRLVVEYAEKNKSNGNHGLITTDLTAQELGWLEGSLLSPFNNYSNVAIEDFAGDIFYNLAKGHNLINGNKRWALVALLHFLETNQYNLQASNKEVLKLARKVVNSDRNDIEKIKKKIKNFLRKKIRLIPVSTTTTGA